MIKVRQAETDNAAARLLQSGGARVAIIHRSATDKAFLYCKDERDAVAISASYRNRLRGRTLCRYRGKNHIVVTLCDVAVLIKSLCGRIREILRNVDLS